VCFGGVFFFFFFLFVLFGFFFLLLLGLCFCCFWDVVRFWFVGIGFRLWGVFVYVVSCFMVICRLPKIPDRGVPPAGMTSTAQP